MSFNPEDLICWEELSNSLKERFYNIEAMINSGFSYFTSYINGCRVTISYEAPLNPRMNKDIWFDLNYNVLRFYISGTWEFTRAAWYGGSSDDVGPIIVSTPSSNYSRLRSLIWVSNSSKNNSYTASGEMPRTDKFVCSEDGWFRIQDRSRLFKYNSQYNYTHDGGAMNVTAFINKINGGTTNLYSASYDAKGTYKSYMTSSQYPELAIQLSKGDKITTSVTTIRNPLSTDSIEIRQISAIYVYKLNYGSYTTLVDPNAVDAG